MGHFTLQPKGLSSARRAELTQRAVAKAGVLCEEELARMPSLLAADEAELWALKGTGVIDESTADKLRLKLALEYRIGVKRTLSDFCKQTLAHQ